MAELHGLQVGMILTTYPSPRNPSSKLPHWFSTSDACDEIPGPSLTRPGFRWCESGENLTYPNLGSGSIDLSCFARWFVFKKKVSKRKWILETLNQPRVTRCVNKILLKSLPSLTEFDKSVYLDWLFHQLAISLKSCAISGKKHLLTVRFTTYCNEVFLGHVVTSRLCCFLLCFLFCFLFTQKIFDSWFLWKNQLSSSWKTNTCCDEPINY